MIVKDIGEHIEAARRLLEAGDLDGAHERLSVAAKGIDLERMLTTTEAAHLLGIRSKNTIKAMVRRGQITAAQRGYRVMIPMAEVVRLQGESVVHDLRRIEHDYDRMKFPGSDDPVGDEELENMSENRPGILPWRR